MTSCPPPGCVARETGAAARAEAARAAAAALSARHLAERALRAWVGPLGPTAEGAKATIIAALTEYFATGDVAELASSLRDLELPFFMHEAVKRCCVLALEKGGTALDKGACALAHLAACGIFSATQLRAGLARAADAVSDLELDVPGASSAYQELLKRLRELQAVDS